MEQGEKRDHEQVPYEAPVLEPAGVRFGSQGRSIASLGNIFCNSCSSGLE